MRTNMHVYQEIQLKNKMIQFKFKSVKIWLKDKNDQKKSQNYTRRCIQMYVAIYQYASLAINVLSRYESYGIIILDHQS